MSSTDTWFVYLFLLENSTSPEYHHDYNLEALKAHCKHQDEEVGLASYYHLSIMYLSIVTYLNRSLSNLCSVELSFYNQEMCGIVKFGTMFIE